MEYDFRKYEGVDTAGKYFFHIQNEEETIKKISKYIRGLITIKHWTNMS